MTTISITGKQPGKTAVTISSTVNPAVKTVVPVTVLSRNLLSYGPASGHGLTATINGDGSLHIKGTPTRQWTGLSWKFPCPVHGIVTFGGTTISGLGGVIKCLDGDGRQLGSQITVGSNGVAIPDGTVSLQLNILATETTPTMKDGDIRIQLESGDTVHEWMKPDDTSLEGGGYELANLVPSFTSILPKTVEGVTFTSTDGHTIHAKGTATAWAHVGVSVRLDAGTYMLTCDNSNGWNYGCQFIGGNNNAQLGGASVKLEAGDYGVNMFVAEGKTVDIDLTPRIHRLD